MVSEYYIVINLALAYSYKVSSFLTAHQHIIGY